MEVNMLSNKDYLRDFIRKHRFSYKITIQCYKSITYDSIQTVVFDKKDIPSGLKVNMDDIRYDIDSDLPADVFLRWLEYRDNNPDSKVSFIYWMTKMDNAYEPMGIDKSSSYKMKDDIYNALNQLKNMRWF